MILKKLAMWTMGISTYYYLTWVYDYVVISGLILYFGILIGTIIAVILSFIIDYLTLLFYDWSKKDWLALETIKQGEEYTGFFGKLVKFTRNKGLILSIFILSLTSNAFIVTVYLRKGSNNYNGLTKRDWFVFVLSSLITNFYWVFLIAGGIEIIKIIYSNFLTNHL